jgi:hypothetical protein
MSDATPWFPDFSQLMPTKALDGLIALSGIRFGWMKSHACPCVLGNADFGSPNPNCNTCHGRGIYWDQWTNTFRGLLTFMHTSSAPDEPGNTIDKTTGGHLEAEPTLTIPTMGPDAESTVWTQATNFDAYVELDALTRFSTVLRVGDTSILPYQQQLDVQSVAVWDPIAMTAGPIPPADYAVTGASVTLAASYPEGTAYTVEYIAAPVYVAFRSAGGMPHTRPFAGGTAMIPRRFRVVLLDLWTRSRDNGYLGQSTSPQGLATP